MIAGAGGPLGHAIEPPPGPPRKPAPTACWCCRRTSSPAPSDGLVAYVEAVAAASDLPVIVYHRGSAQYSRPTPCAPWRRTRRSSASRTALGDIGTGAGHRPRCGRATGREDFAFFNGLLTAELTQGAYRGIGIPLYSSAAFAMIPGGRERATTDAYVVR